MQSAHDAVIRTALARYDDPLLRAVAAKLFKPRSHWPLDELIDRAVESLANAPVIDRRLKDLPTASRRFLAAAGLSRQSVWPVGQVLAMLATLGHSEGLAPVLALLDAGLAVPILPEEDKPIRRWEDWLGTAPTAARLSIPPTVAGRATREGTGLPQLPGKKFDPKVIHSADGLEWPLRLGVVWQQLRATPIRLTQGNYLFKRDLTRLQADPLLGSSPTDIHIEVPDPGVLAMGLGIAAGLFVADGGDLRRAVSAGLGCGTPCNSRRPLGCVARDRALGPRARILPDRRRRAIPDRRARGDAPPGRPTGWRVDPSVRRR